MVNSSPCLTVDLSRVMAGMSGLPSGWRKELFLWIHGVRTSSSSATKFKAYILVVLYIRKAVFYIYDFIVFTLDGPVRHFPHSEHQAPILSIHTISCFKMTQRVYAQACMATVHGWILS